VNDPTIRPAGGRPTVHVRGIGVLAPGLADWSSGQDALKTPAELWRHAPTVAPTASRLPPAERRRAGDIVKLSLAVADQACAQARVDTSTLATVFSASTGDARNCHSLCEALAAPERLVSPTRFTNSVHNASAGYWHIACGSQAPSTSLCAYDGSFCAGLLEAVTQCIADQRPILLVTADVPYPEPLHGVRPISETMAVALVIDVEPHAGDLATITLGTSDQAPSPCDEAGLETLRLAVPSGRALPLLQALARLPQRRAGHVVLDYLAGLSLDVELVS